MYKRLMESYDPANDKNGVSGERIAFRLHALSQIGLGDRYSCNRVSFSKEEQQAKELVMHWMKEAGLDVRQDGVNNVIGRLKGATSETTIMSGSHLDSVPKGGQFDGPLGVISALEVAQAWKDEGFVPAKSYEVIVFTDEEGARFQSGLSGSQAMVGEWNLEKKKRLRDQEGKTFEDVLQENGLSFQTLADAKRDFSEVETFVEVHIEQGKRLEKAGLPVGVVEGIAGPSWLEVIFAGEAGHAGNTPMNDRSDALVAASQFISAVESLPPDYSHSAVATVGQLSVSPNGVNVIPGEVRLTVDIRDIHKKHRNDLRDRIRNVAKKIAERRAIDVSVDEIMSEDPVPVTEALQQKAAQAVKAVTGNPALHLPSGAGHDAMIIGRKTDIAMLFTRSQDGISHNPAEWSSLNDCVVTVHALKTLVEDLIKG
ncbi:Zn-dependent hydrolase [Salisediminibacterium beveridgei]|uniref:N-carbamoyl-L-amino acid amidohydrolase n=1 Tax=Salisediminibacterium beveridgei TaxID=632773 RepID=A0A1D7QRZ4_9BACI|nr:Zn-dependent hydrolase [Salisediminibacterium beveridgei]AOM81780.1 N-carbamoyl-L-amino acid amidohydrolase [Salisediminibacterium beveridgei]